MAEVDFEQAVQALRSHLGAQYEGMEADGRDDMKDVLKNELGYSDNQAGEAIDAMISAGTLRYSRSSPLNDNADTNDETTVAAIPAVPGAAGAGVGTTGYAGTPLVPVPIGGGYWQIGAGDEAESGRKGQISPE